MARQVEIDSNQIDWTPTRWPGISIRSLRRDPETGARASLLKFDPGAYMSRHLHPAGEEAFVLEGRLRFEETWYEAGAYLYSPPGSSDDVYSDTGGLLFVSLPEPAVHP
jgi:quercetin dioxygenase-like cupin family protein